MSKIDKKLTKEIHDNHIDSAMIDEVPVKDFTKKELQTVVVLLMGEINFLREQLEAANADKHK